MNINADWDIPDPTSLNVRRQLNRLLEQLPKDSPISSAFHAALSQNAFLPTLSRFMLQPSFTLVISWTFRPLLMDLCARWLENNVNVYEKLEALALLIETHEELFPILSSFLLQFKRGPLHHLMSETEFETIENVIIQRVLLAYYRILRATPTLPKSLNWDLSLLLKLCTTPRLDRGTRWLAIRCYALQSKMSESIRLQMEQEALGQNGAEDCTINYGEDITGAEKEADGWILPVLEVNRIQNYRNSILESSDYFDRSEASDIQLSNKDLSPLIVNVHGILLLRTPSSKPISSSLVLTSPALKTLRQLAVNISLCRPILLTSTPSSGKTTLLNHFANLLHPTLSNQIVIIYLADTSLDPRSLLGSYVSSSSTAGTFEWKDGVLVKAMREGRWVVLKDIDRASSEVLGLITPLAESMDDIRPIGSNATLSLGNRGFVEAAESFALFATRSVDVIDISSFPPLSFLGAQKWREIVISENSLDDLQLIVDSKFPQIAGPLSDNLIDIWLMVKRLRLLSSTRPIGIRDLEKFCSRVSQLLESARAIPHLERRLGEALPSLAMLLPHPSLREEIYLEAQDVFFSAGAFNKSALEQREAISTAIAEKLGLSEETKEWLLKRRTPVFEVEKDVDGRSVAVKAGRVTLRVDPSSHLYESSSARSFSMHRQAVRLISQLAASVKAIEPVLLTGETGTGKTSVVSYLASLLNKPLVSLNLSNQSEASDLIGGFRPVSARVPALELQQRFIELFQKTFSNKKNEHLLQSLRKAVANSKWKVAIKLWTETSRTAVSKLKEKGLEHGDMRPVETLDTMDSLMPRKRRKVHNEMARGSEADWTAFLGDAHQFEVQHVLDKGKFSFHFVEGPLVKAIRTGAWVLLDEINLASPEVLECIAGLLQSPEASVTLTEQGSLEPVPRHPGFRLFACMNPATDVGKKDLPSNIRARFTEIEVPPPDEDREALVNIITHYIGHLAVTDKAVIFDIAEFYTSVKRLAASGKIADGSDHRPHYSMRSLSRALTFASDTIQSFGLRRALWEGFTMTFTMVLDQPSSDAVLDLARRTLLSSVKNKIHFLSIQPPSPHTSIADSPVRFGPFWLSSGPSESEEVSDYILTPSVQKKLVDLARIVLIKRYPVLIEGPTSSGKTSAIQYLARRTGHNFVRINNHEHTDIQEYLGSYVSDSRSGKLIFRDGLLVRALRRGDWIVLDELNLAPTDVLEALNRLLDDNRELVIPETQEVVKPHPHFMLFATQNPSGVYAGRKVLSRALRNRFLEVHFEDVPPNELEHILSQRSRIAPSYSQRIVAVFHELQKRRQIGRIFEGKEGFATLRDLFRWAGRDAQGYQDLADNGYMLLAERARHEEDRIVVKEVIEKVMNITISEEKLYSMDLLDPSLESIGNIVWTKPMQRLYVLLTRALKYNEPVLLVGETGSGKTSVCQVYAEIQQQVLRTVNCHQNTEAADIIGGLRPARREGTHESGVIREAMDILGVTDVSIPLEKNQISKEIESRLSTELRPQDRGILLAAQQALLSRRGLLCWQDGPLVASMRTAGLFLLDEISLADDSVLERLNSVLEPSRTLILAERGGETTDDFQVIAHDNFKFVATMNPGGDFGKKELSPALRNRFTEIWVPSLMNRVDLIEIIKHSWKYEQFTDLTYPLLDFVDWIMSEVKDTSILTLRDILSWIKFCNTLSQTTSLPPGLLFVHGGEMAVIDGLSSLTQLSSWSAEALQDLARRACSRLIELIPDGNVLGRELVLEPSTDVLSFGIGPFSVHLGPEPQLSSFSFKAPTSLKNAFRLLRACQISKPILLEGSPGVGKTSLVSALAAAAGQKLCRINLSEQTDLVDLFGSDLPVDGNASGNFSWSDAEFLRALKNGYWVLLDEMNLASQSVLEGLNAVFDHRGTVYIPELDSSFTRHANFRVFAAQNPLNQGSGRKGLPKSFLNRFTKIFVDKLSSSDLLLICQHLFPTIESNSLELMITFNCRLHDEVVVQRRFGGLGAPWEFNLRDIIRWASLMVQENGSIDKPWKYLNVVYGSRLRTNSDRTALLKLFVSVFGDADIFRKIRPRFIATPGSVCCGDLFLRKGFTSETGNGVRLFKSHIGSTESALSSIAHNWLVIVTGPHSSGKTSFARALASISSQSLREMALGSSSDTSDLIGSFEQTNVDFHIHHLLESLIRFVDSYASQAHFKNGQLLGRILELKETAIGIRSLESLQEIVQTCLSSSPSNIVAGESIASLKVALELSTKQESIGPRFEWIDGPLIRAMRLGEWILLDNANLCSPSVLDRLNSLCELSGAIVLTEKGVDQEIVYPHPNFRLIMTVDPHRGEISRAMRNRGIEIALESSVGLSDEYALQEAKRMALHQVSIFTRPDFELSRRALHVLNMPHPVEGALSTSSDLSYVDSLSSKLANLGALIAICDSSHHIAIILFLFSYSSPFITNGLHRLLKPGFSSRGPLLSELFSFLLAGSNGLRSAITAMTGAYRGLDSLYLPLNPFLLSPTIDWLPSVDQDVCMITSLMLESYLLASDMELQLLNQDRIMMLSELTENLPMSGEQDAVNRFLQALVPAARNFISKERSNTESVLLDVQAILELLQYTQHIRQATNHRITDFSTLHAASASLLRCAKAVSHILPGIEGQAKAVTDVYALCSGQRISEIWGSLYQPKLPSRALALLDRLETLSPEAHMSVIELVSLIGARQGTDEELSKVLMQVEARIAQNFNIYKPKKPTSHPVETLAMLTMEMSGLSCLNPNESKSNIKEVIRVLGQTMSPSEHSLRIVAYQRVSWKLEAGIVMISEIADAHIEWHKALWKQDDLILASGPSALFTPILLRSTITASSHAAESTLDSIKDHRSLLNDQINRSLFDCLQVQNRENLLLGFLLQSIVLILSACFPKLAEDHLITEALREIANASEFQKACCLIVDTLFQLDDDTFSTLRNALTAVSQCEDWSDLVYSMGKCWIVLAQTAISLYVPNISIDPLRVQSFKSSFRGAQKSWLHSQIYVHTSWEKLESGSRDNIFIRLLQHRLQHLLLDSNEEMVKHDFARQGDLVLLQAFWNEIRNFVTEIISSERLERFILATVEARSEVSSQESLLQDSISSFIQRIKGTYSQLQDLTPAIELAMMQLRFGLRTIRHSATMRASPLLSPEIHKILSFPTIQARNAASVISSKDLIRPGFSPGDSLLLQLVAISRNTARGDSLRRRMLEVNNIYEQISILWNSDITNEAERLRQSESLYRSKQITHDSVEDDPEDAQVACLFPTFMEDEAGDDLISEEKKTAGGGSNLSSGFSEKLLLIHSNLFGNEASYAQRELDSVWRSLCSQMVSSWVEGPLLYLSCNVDQEALAFRLDILHRMKSRFHRNDGANAFSFYRDPDLREAGKLASLVNTLREELNKLICLWPDQLVLQHLKDRCDSILSMNMSSSVAKMLGAVERLLIHTEDWEMFANRDNSLSVHRQAMTELIVEWRKLELVGWRSILDSEAELFCSELGEWWFRLYDATIRGVVAANQNLTSIDSLSVYLDSLTPLVEDFITSSPLGQFKRRLQLVQSFALMTSELAVIENNQMKEALKRSSWIMFSIYHFYGQFVGKLDTLLEEQRTTIEEDIQGLVKLATWRDVNVHALQQSAQRTHKQLYRRIRKFRELLRQPIADQLQVGSRYSNVPPTSSVEQSVETISLAYPDGVEMRKASKLFIKFSSVLMKGTSHILDSSSALSIEELSNSIVSLQGEYALATPPKTLSSDEQKKWVSALLARKRRSWNELLKELKRIGISPNVKPEILQRHRTRRCLMEQPRLDTFAGTSFESKTKKVDLYFYRSISLLNDLLQCAATHHPDIATRDLQRGLSSFESAFAFATSARMRISELATAWRRLQLCSRRLHDLKDSQDSCATASISIKALHGLIADLSGTSDAIKELIHTADKISETSDGSLTINSIVFDDLHRWESACIDILSRLSSLLRDVDSIDLMTVDDIKLIRKASKHLEHSSSLLLDLGTREPRIKRFCIAIRESFQSHPIDIAFLDFPVNDLSIVTESKKTVDLLLAIGQELVATSANQTMEVDLDDADHVHRYVVMQSQISRVLRMGRVTSQVQLFSRDLHRKSRTATADALSQTLPFLDHFVTFVERCLNGHVDWVKSLLKLTYISGSLIRTISQNGFCKPPDIDDSSETEGAVESAEGTGLGHGEGKEDVSKQIEDESQFEGVKGQEEETANGQQKEDDHDNALDVDFDLGGELEDGPEQESAAESDDDAMSNLDEEFGQDDSYDELKPFDVDFWNDKADDKDNSADGNDMDERKAEEGDSEMVAKEQEDKKGEAKPKEESNDKGNEVDEKDIAEKPDSDVAGENEDRLINQEQGRDAEMDDDAERPQLEGEHDGVDVPEGEEGMIEDLDDLNIDEEPVDGEHQDQNNYPESANDEEDDIDAQETQAESTNKDDGDKGEGEATAGNGDDGAEMGADDASGAREDESRAFEETAADLPPAVDREPKESASTGNSTQNIAPNEVVPSAQANPDATARGTEMGQSSSAPSDTPLPNPHRRLGDALREVRRRFDEIKSFTDSESISMPIENIPNPVAIEYAPEETMDVDMQALGPAMGEESAKLNELNVFEEHDDMQAAAMSDIPPTPEGDVQCSSENSRQDKEGERNNEQKKEDDLQAMDVDNPEGPGELPNLSIGEDELNFGKKVEVEASKWRREGQPEEDGQRIWQLYDALTQSLSFSLCEQLRLILEPTRATRLMGDFRTGKRLNMKKIIPYIASNYTKDKIWLRRVRPSQREYQILIALDDSRSMAESHSIHLAFQTLALVSKALNRLEVGDVAIASFGEKMKMLHGFENGPFSDQAGTKIVEAFKFAQTTTDVRVLLESSVEALNKARERRVSSSSSDLWQLEIIISDGICQDHEEMRAIMRKAEEEHILVVFIIIDAHHEPSIGDSTSTAAHSQNSIINMNQATYRTVNGLPELHMQRYLDSFPFEFFVVLNSVETLPDVLADTLRQFFERISAS